MSSRTARSASRPLGLLISLALLALASLASTPTRVEATGSSPAQATGCSDVGGNFADPGPFEVTVEPAAQHTYYSPTELGTQGCTTHPVIVWGNGTWTTPDVYDQLLRHLASQGFVVAAANTSNAGSGNEIKAGLDNLEGFNSQAGHRFNGKLDLENVGSTGHSQGGGGALEAAKDERIKTTAPLAPFVGSQTGLQPDDTAIFFAGTLDTWIPPDTVKARYDGVTIPAAYAEAADANHFIPAATGGMFRAPLTAWMRWQLMGDTEASGMFIGADCGLCTDPVWTAYEANAALQALGTADPEPPDPGPGPTTPEPPGGGEGGDCVTATNAEHAEAGRLTTFFIFAFTNDSSHFVGLTWSTTTQRRTADGNWEHIFTAC
jgi:hypothetical protein